MQRIGIIGGGASGYFLAANLPKNLNHSVTIFEQAKEPLQKVKISGGGRCNVTHACFDIKDLVQNYPRGKKELLGVFSQFQPKDTMQWFEKNGVPLKIEPDNRVFPVSNQSESIITCLRKKVVENGVSEIFNCSINKITKNTNNTFSVATKDRIYEFDKLVIASGSSKKSWQLMENLGHKIVSPLPSLFTFNCKDKILQEMAGTSFEKAEVKIKQTKLHENGALLITHWGLSGPAILRLSAWGAKDLAELNYDFDLQINWTGQKANATQELFFSLKREVPNKQISNIYSNFNLNKRFWSKILDIAQLDSQITLAQLSNKNSNLLIDILTNYSLKINGKSTFKDEFVTCGGVELKEIDFKTMQSKIVPNLYFAGEVMNIDAITGGFNFQAAWSGAFLLSEHLKRAVAPK